MHKLVHSATLYNSVFLFWSYLGPIGTIWDDLGRFGTIWDHWKPFGTIRTLDIWAIWDHWGPFGTRLGPFGAIWDHLGPNWDHLGKATHPPTKRVLGGDTGGSLVVLR